MKYFKTGIFVAFLIALTACSSDDDNSSQAPDPSHLFGKWFYVSAVGGEPASACEQTSYLEFFPNGKTYTVLKADTFDGGCVTLLDGEHEYELTSPNTIHFKLIDDETEDEFDATIISISSTSLVLKDFVFPDTIITFAKPQ